MNKIIAHRGVFDNKSVPENSMLSFNNAIKYNYPIKVFSIIYKIEVHTKQMFFNPCSTMHYQQTVLCTKKSTVLDVGNSTDAVLCSVNKQYYAL